MQGSQIIVLATPVFLALILLEWWVGVRRGRNTYRVNDAINSIGLGMLSQVAEVFATAMKLGIYTLAFEHLAIWQLPVQSLWVWGLGLLLYDFFYYWHHRFGHTSAVFWAAHVVHHQSEDYNLSTALRQTSSGWLLGWIFYLPMAVLGFPPLVFAVVALIDLLYQYWVHTQQIGRLGWFDRWFCAPSNHRVHHAVNDVYLDRNYGGILILWDRMFGSFQPELDEQPCVYGTRKPLRSWNPLWANLEVYAALAKDSWHARNWLDKVRIWFKPPGWRPAELEARFPREPFDCAQVQRFDPPMSPRRQGLVLALFVVVLTLTAVFLWTVHGLPLLQQIVFALVLALGLWLLGRLCGGQASAPVVSRHAPVGLGKQA